MRSNLQVAVESLIANGFQIGLTDYTAQTVRAIGNEGEEVVVRIGPAGYCYVMVDNFVCTNMSQPYHVGEAARLKRHVGMFENVTMETKI